MNDRVNFSIPVVSIRASSLGELFDCPARWEAKNIRGIRMPSSGAARLGTSVHASTAIFDKAKIDGAPISIDDVAWALVDMLHSTDEEVDWEDTNPNEAEKIGLALHDRYCKSIAPHQDYVAVEARCENLLITDLGINLTGTTDRVYRCPDGSLGIADIKTGKAAVSADGTVKTAGHGPQLGVYELLAEHAISERLTAPAQIIGLNTGKTPIAQRVGIGQVTHARDVLIGEDGNPGMLEYAAQIIHSGAFYANPKSILCSAKYCPAHSTCKYKG